MVLNHQKSFARCHHFFVELEQWKERMAKLVFIVDKMFFLGFWVCQIWVAKWLEKLVLRLS